MCVLYNCGILSIDRRPRRWIFTKYATQSVHQLSIIFNDIGSRLTCKLIDFFIILVQFAPTAQARTLIQLQTVSITAEWPDSRRLSPIHFTPPVVTRRDDLVESRRWREQDNSARPANFRGGLYVLLAIISFFLTISWSSQSISGSTESILAIFFTKW